MAIKSYGFGVDATNLEGEIGVVQWAQLSSYLGAQYACLPVGAPNALEGLPAFPVGTQERSLQVRPGAAVAYGVYTISDTPITVALPPTPTGERWHIIGFRRDWTKVPPEPNTTLEALGSGASIAAALSTLTHNPGFLDDQPLHAARVTAGFSEIREVVDLRVWGSGSSLVAQNREVLGYVNRRGTEVQVGDVSYTRVVDPGYGERWSDSRSAGGIIATAVGSFYKLPPSGRLGPSVEVWGNSVQNIAQINIPDPGIPYRIATEFIGFIGSEVADGTRWDLTCMVGSDGVDSLLHAGFYGDWLRWSLQPSLQVFQGPQTVYLRANRVYGSSYGAVATYQRGLAARIYGATL